MALNEGGKSNRIDVLFHTYRENSIKNSERSLRGEEIGMQIVRQWRSFLTTVKNKDSLIGFIVRGWMKAGFREKLQQKVLYATVRDKCYRITSDGSNEVLALQCQQEEADGRLLLHATHAVEEGYEGVVVCSEDTDVFIMALAFKDKIEASLFQKCGTKPEQGLFISGKSLVLLALTFAGHSLAFIHLLAVILLVPLLAKVRQMP